MTNEIPEVR